VDGPSSLIDELGLYHGVLDDSRYELPATCELGSLLASAGLVIPRYR